MEKYLKWKETIPEIPNIQTKVVKPLDLYAINYQRRKRFCYEAHVRGHYSMKEIAKFLGLHYQTVCRDLLQFERMLECET